ncbi:MAG: metal ABC transporter permease [Paracoccaceae bacterium]
MVAVALKVVGALLIAGDVIIPAAAAARGLARSPESMAVGAIGVGVLGARRARRLVVPRTRLRGPRSSRRLPPGSSSPP